MTHEAWYILRALLSLVVVLALAVLVLRFGLPLFVRRRFRRKGRVEVLETYPLDRQHVLVLVRAVDRVMLIGYGNGSFVRLAEWVGDDIPAVLGETPPAAPEGRRSRSMISHPEPR